MLHVACYVIYDPFTAQLDVYRLDASRREYERVEPNARGHFACEPLGMSVGVVRSTIDAADAPWLRLIDAEGVVVPEPSERARHEAVRAKHEAERAKHEAERADRAEAEIARLRAELARRGD